MLVVDDEESVADETTAGLGVEAFLMKPVGITELAGAVRRALDATGVPA